MISGRGSGPAKGGGFPIVLSLVVTKNLILPVVGFIGPCPNLNTRFGGSWSRTS